MENELQLTGSLEEELQEVLNKMKNAVQGCYKGQREVQPLTDRDHTVWEMGKAAVQSGGFRLTDEQELQVMDRAAQLRASLDQTPTNLLLIRMEIAAKKGDLVTMQAIAEAAPRPQVENKAVQLRAEYGARVHGPIRKLLGSIREEYAELNSFRKLTDEQYRDMVYREAISTAKEKAAEELERAEARQKAEQQTGRRYGWNSRVGGYTMLEPEESSKESKPDQFTSVASQYEL